MYYIVSGRAHVGISHFIEVTEVERVYSRGGNLNREKLIDSPTTGRLPTHTQTPLVRGNFSSFRLRLSLSLCFHRAPANRMKTISSEKRRPVIMCG